MSVIPARIDAVTLAVSDVGRSAAFYRDVMSFSELLRSPEITKFELQNGEMTLISRDVLLEETHLTAFPAGHGPVTFAVSVARDDVDVYMKRLADAGVNIMAEAEDKRLGPRIGFVADPDGHTWEVIEEVLKHRHDAQASVVVGSLDLNV